MTVSTAGPVYYASVSQRFVHAGRIVEAARFVGNGPEIAQWAGGQADGAGTSGTLRVRVTETNRLRGVDMGDWVVRDGVSVSIVPQETFANGYVLVN